MKAEVNKVLDIKKPSGRAKCAGVPELGSNNVVGNLLPAVVGHRKASSRRSKWSLRYRGRPQTV